MDGKELRDLIELIAKSNFVTFELEREGFRLKLDKGAGLAVAAPMSRVATPMTASARPSATATVCGTSSRGEGE